MVHPKKNQVVCAYAKIKEGHLEDARNWLKALEDRKDETLESFQQEGILMESAFIREENGQYFLIYYLRAHDVEKARAVFRESTLPIDLFHKECRKKFIENQEILSPAFHVDIFE